MSIKRSTPEPIDLTVMKKEYDIYSEYITQDCEIRGVREVIRQLIECGATEDILTNMSFDKDDIQNVFIEINAEKDQEELNNDENELEI